MIGASIRFLIASLVVALIMISFAPTATAEYPNPDQLCQFDEASVVIALVDGSTIEPGESETFVNGSTFRVALCRGDSIEPTSAWQLAPIDGLTEIATTTNYRTLKVTAGDNTESPITFEGAILERDSVDSPRISIFVGYVMRSSLNDDVRIQFHSEQRLQDYQAAENDFMAANRQIQNISNSLNEMAVQNETKLAEQADSLASEANESIVVLKTSHETLEQVLYESATHGGAGAIQALESADHERNASLEAIRSSAVNGRQTLKAASEQTARSILINFLILVIPGFLIGSVLSGYYTKRRLEDVAYMRSRTSSVDFRIQNIAGPLILAGLLILASVIILLLTVGPDSLVAVIQSLT